MTYTQSGVGNYLRLVLSYPDSFAGNELLVAADELARAVAFADFRSAVGASFLSYICVAEHVRGRGVAASLINHFCDQQTASVARLDLDVFDDNHAARALYTKLGFLPTTHSSWVRRQMPPASTPLAISSIKDVHASLQQYGFCDMTLAERGLRFGIMGGNILRCFDMSHLTDDDLLARLKATFPSLTHAFAVARDIGEVDARWPDTELLCHSTRMSKALATKPQSGERTNND